MSESSNVDYTEFDRLLDPKGPAMIAGQQLLKIAAVSSDNVVFPPSYANPSEKKDDPPVYNIDVLDPSDTSKNVCVLDSIPSQANRMEPLFGEPPNDALIPQYNVKFNDELPVVNITQIGHRIADAAFRGTKIRDEIVVAFREYARGNAEKLARIAPTSIVFGTWDSRGTGVKVPRLINSIIRAFNVSQLKRSAQYTPPIKYEQEGMIPAGLEGKPADHGLADVPATHKIGGIQVSGDIRRDFSLNLELLRDLHAPLTDDEKKAVHESEHQNEPEADRNGGIEKAFNEAQREADLKLQRYILGLALLAFTATQKTHLRQGCQLLPKGEPTWKRFSANGTDDAWTPPSNIAELTQHAASDFGAAQPSDQLLVFNKDLLKASINVDAKKKADKKAENAGDPIENLKNLVNELEPTSGDKFSTAKNSKLTKLRAAITKTQANASAAKNLKVLAANLTPLLIADAGAAERKTKMLALFPVPDEQSTNTSDETVAEDNEDAQS